MQKLLLCVAALLAFTSCDDVLLDSVDKRVSDKTEAELTIIVEPADTIGDEKTDSVEVRYPITFDVNAESYNEIEIDI